MYGSIEDALKKAHPELSKIDLVKSKINMNARVWLTKRATIQLDFRTMESVGQIIQHPMICLGLLKTAGLWVEI